MATCIPSHNSRINLSQEGMHLKLRCMPSCDRLLCQLLISVVVKLYNYHRRVDGARQSGCLQRKFEESPQVPPCVTWQVRKKGQTNLDLAETRCPAFSELRTLTDWKWPRQPFSFQVNCIRRTSIFTMCCCKSQHSGNILSGVAEQFATQSGACATQ